MPDPTYFHAHQAAVAATVTSVRERLTAADGSAIADDAAPREAVTCGQLRTLLAEIDRLKSLLRLAAEHEYNAFEPDNQSDWYRQLMAEFE